jgi:hypothetical protein
VLWAKGELLEAAGRREEAVQELRRAIAGRPHLKDAVLALERLGALEAKDAEVAELAFGRWRVFVNQGRYYTTNADYPRLSVPLELIGEGQAQALRLVEFEVKAGPQTGIGILRFVAGQVEDASGKSVEVEHGAVLDLQAGSVLAVETMRQGIERASWTWGEDKLAVKGLDGFTQEYVFKVSKPAEPAVAAAKPDAEAQKKIAKARPRQARDETPSWVPWGGGQRSSDDGGRRRQPKTLFELLFSN